MKHNFFMVALVVLPKDEDKNKLAITVHSLTHCMTLCLQDIEGISSI